MALPKFEDWKPSWEVKGEDFNAETAKKFIYNLEVDKDQLNGVKATLTQERDAAVTARDTLQAAVDAKAREGESAEQKAVRLEQELAALRAAPAPGAVSPEVQQARLMAALEVDGIAAKDALTLSQYIQGTTKDEAAASAKSFVETFGIPGVQKPAEGVEGGSEVVETNPLLQQARTVNNPLTPIGQGGELPVDKALDLIPRL